MDLHAMMMMSDVGEIPKGCRFQPTDHELIQDYLVAKVEGFPLPWMGISERDVYGGAPWNVFSDIDDDNSSLQSVITKEVKKTKEALTFYVFTKLPSSNSKKKVGRTAGCGTWDGQTGRQAIKDLTTGEKIGFVSMFSFKQSDRDKVEIFGHWIMHEYSLCNSKEERSSDLVVCKITRYMKNENLDLLQIYNIQNKRTRADDQLESEGIDHDSSKKYKYSSEEENPMTLGYTLTGCGEDIDQPFNHELITFRDGSAVEGSFEEYQRRYQLESGYNNLSFEDYLLTIFDFEGVGEEGTTLEPHVADIDQLEGSKSFVDNEACYNYSEGSKSTRFVNDNEACYNYSGSRNIPDSQMAEAGNGSGGMISHNESEPMTSTTVALPTTTTGDCGITEEALNIVGGGDQYHSSALSYHLDDNLDDVLPNLNPYDTSEPFSVDDFFN